MRISVCSLFLGILVLLAARTGDGNAVRGNFTGVFSQSVTLQCPRTRTIPVTRLYIHKETETNQVFINGFDAERALPVDFQYKYRTSINRTDLSMEMKNISFPDEGLYKCIVFYTPTDKEEFTLHLKVTAPLPVPVIHRDSSSSSKCVVLCSVLNVRDVSLSWYKGNCLLSNISVSDLNIRLSLPLEVEYQDTNTYRCVVNNPISNQTQNLNITQLCQTCSNVMTLTVLIISVVLLVFMSVAVIHCYCRKSLQTIQEDEKSFSV